MQILLASSAVKPRLQDWESRPIAPCVALGPKPRDSRDAHERVVGIEAPGPPEPAGLHRRAARAILAFQVFPRRVGQGILRRSPVEVGDTAGLRYHFVPGLDLFFASRVVRVFDGPEGPLWRTGFTYRTLQGHPELGEETFLVEKDLATGRVLVALRSWSRPGTMLARVFAPIVRGLQLRGGRSALDELEKAAREPNYETVT